MAKAKQTTGEEVNERFTLFAPTTTIAKLDYISRQLTARKDQKVTRTDVVNEALEAYIKKWEAKEGEIKLK